MTIPLQTVPMIVFVGMVLCWFVFATGPALMRALDAVPARTKRSSCGRRTSQAWDDRPRPVGARTGQW